MSDMLKINLRNGACVNAERKQKPINTNHTTLFYYNIKVPNDMVGIP